MKLELSCFNETSLYEWNNLERFNKQYTIKLSYKNCWQNETIYSDSHHMKIIFWCYNILKQNFMTRVDMQLVGLCRNESDFDVLLGTPPPPLINCGRARCSGVALISRQSPCADFPSSCSRSEPNQTWRPSSSLLYIYILFHSRCGTLESPHCPMAMGAEYSIQSPHTTN